MKRVIFAFLIFLLFSFISKEPSISNSNNLHSGYTLVRQITLPDKLNETSGLTYYSGLVWSFNDSGGDPEIYGYSLADSAIEQTITVNNGVNADWEDISQDSSFIYAGDFGNNFGTRDTLCIYKIPKKKIPVNRKSVSVVAQKILFTYPNYKPAFVPVKRSRFDCEAMVWKNDSIYLFSKDWENETSTIYVLPAKPGKYTAKPIGQFNSRCLITAAAYNGKVLYLLGYSNYKSILWKFENPGQFRLHDEDGERVVLSFFQSLQTEGIVIKDSTTLLISSEKTQVPPGLYIVKLER